MYRRFPQFSRVAIEQSRELPLVITGYQNYGAQILEAVAHRVRMLSLVAQGEMDDGRWVIPILSSLSDILEILQITDTDSSFTLSGDSLNPFSLLSLTSP